jgi:O-antigen/teichoic acid export membrane protein
VSTGADPASATAAPVEADVLATPEAGRLVIRGGTLRVAGYGLTVLVSLVSAPFLIRHLGVSGYGRFVTVTSLVTIIGAITDAGMGTIGLREYASRVEGGRDSFMRNLLGIRLALTVAGVGATMVVLALIASRRVPLAGFALVSAGLLLTVIHHTYAIPLSARLHLGSVTAIELAKSVVGTAVVVAFVVADLTLNWFFASAIPIGVAGVVFTVLVVRRSVPLVPALRLGESWTLLRDAFVFSAASVLGFLYYRVAIIILTIVSTERQTGFFSASFRVIDTLTVVPVLLVSAAFPVVSRAASTDEARFEYGLQRLFDVSLILGAWFALATAVAAKPAISILAGDGFGPSATVLRVQGISLLPTFLGATFGYALLGRRRHAALLSVNLIALVLGVALTLVLAERHGAVGAATATTIAEFGLAGMQAFALLRGAAGPRLSVRIVPRVALAAGAAVGVALLPWFGGLVGVAVASAVFFALLFLFRAVPPEVLEALIRRRVAAP